MRTSLEVSSGHVCHASYTLSIIQDLATDRYC